MKENLPDQQYLTESFNYNPETGALIWKVRPRSHFLDERAFKGHKTTCAGKTAMINNKGWYVTNISGIRSASVRIIIKIMTGVEIDRGTVKQFKDGNTLNTRWSNIVCDYAVKACEATKPLAPTKKVDTKGRKFTYWCDIEKRNKII